jgi:hypothetical protein
LGTLCRLDDLSQQLALPLPVSGGGAKAGTHLGEGGSMDSRGQKAFRLKSRNGHKAPLSAATDKYSEIDHPFPCLQLPLPLTPS